MATTTPYPHRPEPLLRAHRKSWIVLLAVILVPALSFSALWWFFYRPAQEARRSADNLQQIMLALHNHHDTFNAFPTGYFRGVVDPSIHPTAARFSWRVQILPFIDQRKLFDQFHFGEPWNSEHNLKVAAKMPDVFRSRWDPPGTTDAGYLHVEDLDAAFPSEFPIVEGNRSVLFPSNQILTITDGTSETIGVIEVANSGIHWAQPTDITLAEAVALLETGKTPPPGTACIRAASALVGMMDATVVIVPIGIAAADAKALITKNGNEPIDYAALGWEQPTAR